MHVLVLALSVLAQLSVLALSVLAQLLTLIHHHHHHHHGMRPAADQWPAVYRKPMVCGRPQSAFPGIPKA